MDFKTESLKLHEQHRGKVAIQPKVKVKTREDLSAAYTPGVAEPCLRIAENRADAYKYTAKGNLVAVVTDGTAVFGLGGFGTGAAKAGEGGEGDFF